MTLNKYMQINLMSLVKRCRSCCVLIENINLLGVEQLYREIIDCGFMLFVVPL